MWWCWGGVGFGSGGEMRKMDEDFRKASLEKHIDYWPVHKCSICNYQCGYMFFQYEDAEVVYDNGCDCTRRYVKQISSWEAVAEFYNVQTNEKVIEEMKKFWGFEQNINGEITNESNPDQND